MPVCAYLSDFSLEAGGGFACLAGLPLGVIDSIFCIVRVVSVAARRGTQDSSQLAASL